jgi:hypothetical protein
MGLNRGRRGAVVVETATSHERASLASAHRSGETGDGSSPQPRFERLTGLCGPDSTSRQAH